MIMELLDDNGYIKVNKKLIVKCGINGAIMVGELCSEYCY